MILVVKRSRRGRLLNGLNSCVSKICVGVFCILYYDKWNITVAFMEEGQLSPTKSLSSQPGMVNPCCQLLERLPEIYSLKELHQHAFFGRERVNAELMSCNRAVVSPTNIGTISKATLWGNF